MKKLSKNQKLIGFIAILLIVVIVAIVITTNVVNKGQVASEKYSTSTANAGSSLISNYILNGITIGGITGKMEVLDTSDATAREEDIAWKKTGYVNGKKVVGTYVPSNNYTWTDSLGNDVKVPRGIWSSKSRG